MTTSSRLPQQGSQQVTRPVAAAVWALAIGIPAVLLVLLVATPFDDESATLAIPLYMLIVTTWGVTGAFIAVRRPANRVPWIMLAASAGVGLALVGSVWAYRSVAQFGGDLPGTEAAALVGLLFGPSLSLAFLVPLFFPDGRLPSPRWRPFVVLILLAAAAALIGVAIRPGPIEGAPGIDNPLGIPALGGLPQSLVDLAGLGTLLCIPAGMIAAVLRYRRGSLVERKQLQWFGSVVVLAFSAFLAAAILPQPYGQGAWWVASLSIGLIPISIGIAILRYRLYDIDRIISRTVSYGLVTVTLAAVFVAVVIGLQQVLATFLTGGNTIAVAASTLVVAALFQPLRSRTQRVVDRRFDRARYDGDQTTAAFARRLRDEVDIDTVTNDLQTTIDGSISPTRQSLWLRDRAGSVT
jgi:hypothetical protein